MFRGMLRGMRAWWEKTWQTALHALLVAVFAAGVHWLLHLLHLA